MPGILIRSGGGVAPPGVAMWAVHPRLDDSQVRTASLDKIQRVFK